MIYFVLWWFIIELLGWLAFPLAMRVLKFLPDRGYIFSKSLGLLITSYLLWLGASTRFLYNDTGGIIFSILILAGLSAWCLRRHLTIETIRNFLREKQRLVLTTELLFGLSFAIWTLLRAYAPYKIMSTGGEKFMEIAFLNSILNSKQFPPLDPWLSGFSISYYYFGYIMMAMITRLSGAPAGIGFDLYDALLFALTAIGAFGVVYNLTASRQTQSDHASSARAIRFGLVGTLCVAVLGNWEGVLEALYSKKALPESFWKWINIPDLLGAPANGTWYPGSGGGWWWWRASRVLQDLDLDYQPVPVSPISEFPFFSFILGDNHPHVLALPFVFLAIMLAFHIFRSVLHHQPLEENEIFTFSEKPVRWYNLVKSWRIDGVFFLISALVLGGLAFLNTWDFPIYLGLLLLAYGSGLYLQEKHFSLSLLLRTALLGAGLMISSISLYLFFYLSFSSQAAGILPYIFPPTRLPQYLVMFGTFFVILAGFLGAYFFSRRDRLFNWRKELIFTFRNWLWVILVSIVLFFLLLFIAILTLSARADSTQALNPVLQAALGGRSIPETLKAVLSARLRDPWLFLCLSALLGLLISHLINYTAARTPSQNEPSGSKSAETSDTDIFVFLLIFTGLLLTFTTEFLYLRDSFGYRMNTIFKFYYQAWIMLGCASAYAIGWFANPGKQFLPSILRITLQGFSLVFILAGMVYSFMAFYSRVNGFLSIPNLDGASEFAQNNPEDWAVIQWLRQNALKKDPVPVLLEAPGTSYTYEGRISAFTGIPAVLGWAVHESQWRGNYEEQGKREPDIATIYTTSDVTLTLELLRKWKVNYVILGQAEYNYIQRQCQDATRRCNMTTVLRKFEQALQPVFTQGSTILYQVP